MVHIDSDTMNCDTLHIQYDMHCWKDPLEENTYKTSYLLLSIPFVYSLIQKTFVEHPLYAKHYARSWSTEMMKTLPDLM